MTGGDIDVSYLAEEVISSFYKGLPIDSHGKTIREFLDSKPSLFSSGFQFPMAVLKESALRHNISRMAEYCQEKNVALSPHVKTTMSPQIAKMQIDAGAWGVTVANYFQANVLLDFGFRRVFIANELLEPTAIRSIAKMNFESKAEIFFYVDSLSGLNLIQNALSTMDKAELNLIIEIGMQGARGGIRHLSDVEPLARKIAEDPRLRLRGVSGFEGILNVHDRSESGSIQVRELCRAMVEAARISSPYIVDGAVILTAGGSAYFDIVVHEFAKYEGDSLFVLRSGAYVSHDHGGYELTYPFANEAGDKRFLPAIEVWAQVISQPEAGLAILNFGKRDVGSESINPKPIKRARADGQGSIEEMVGNIDRLNDQHGYLYFEDPQQVSLGDLIGLGISHPCTTFDKWRYIALVDDQYRVIDLLHTYF